MLSYQPGRLYATTRPSRITFLGCRRCPSHSQHEPARTRCTYTAHAPPAPKGNVPRSERSERSRHPVVMRWRLRTRLLLPPCTASRWPARPPTSNGCGPLPVHDYPLILHPPGGTAQGSLDHEPIMASSRTETLSLRSGSSADEEPEKRQDSFRRGVRRTK